MTEPRDEEAVDEKTARVAEVLTAAARIAGRSRLSLEQQMGLSSGYLSKILGGTVELRLRHVSMILDALEVDPADFFRVAFPRRQSTSRTGRRLMEDVESFLARGSTPEALTDDELDEQVRRSLARLLGLSPGTE
jgi:transcriptional regulator with XRE-family HTH domain